MGSQQSRETMPQNPLFKKIGECLYLMPIKDNITFSLAHRHFAIEFVRIEKAKFDRSMNPFCPIRIKDSDKITTCCLVSPILAIVSGQQIAKKGSNKGKFQCQCEILPVFKRLEVKLQAQDAYLVGEGNIGLLFLESPYWKVGWSGLSYINSLEDLQKCQLKMVSHPEKFENKQQNKTVYVQQVRRLKISKINLDSNFCSQVSGVPGSIVCKLVEKKPYIIGIQISQTKLKFIDQQLFKAIQQKCREYIRERGEKEILKEMDLQQFQIQIQL